MQRKMMLRTLSYVAFVITAVFTSLLMLTSANTLLEQVLSVGMAVVMQASSFIFMQLYVSEGKRFYAGLSSVLFLISIFATLCLQINQLNILQNEQMIESGEYRQQEEAKKLADENRKISISVLEEKKKEKASLEQQTNERASAIKASFEKNIALLEKQKETLEQYSAGQVKSAEAKIQQRVNSLPSDYLTQRKNTQAEGMREVEVLRKKNQKKIDEISNKIIKEQDKMRAEIEKITNENISLLEGKSKEIDDASNKINVASPTVATTAGITAVQKKSEKGFLGFVTMIETWDLKLRDILILSIGLILASAFEVTAIGLYVASNNIVEEKKKLIIEDKPKEIVPTPPEVKEKATSTTVDVIKKKSPEFTQNKVKSEIAIDEEVTDIEIQKYLKIARKTATESGRCIGYKKIGELAGIKNSYKIYNHLRAKGIIKIENNNAYIERIKKDEKLA